MKKAHAALNDRNTRVLYLDHFLPDAIDLVAVAHHELTKHFTAEDRKAIEEEKRRLRASLQPAQKKKAAAPS